MKVNLYNQNAESAGTVELSDGIFGLPLNKDLLYQVVTSQLANTRRVIAHAKGRNEVRGGGKKPWRQKGTGRARHGSIRSPIWKGGGVTHGPTKERNFKKKINRKVARKALLVALSSKIRDNEMIILNDIKLDNWKTKEMAKIMKGFLPVFGGRISSALIVTPGNSNDTIYRAAKNLPNVDIIEAKNLNALKVMSRKNILMLKDSITAIIK
jgi:large subunit ribosomal protein L4